MVKKKKLNIHVHHLNNMQSCCTRKDFSQMVLLGSLRQWGEWHSRGKKNALVNMDEINNRSPAFFKCVIYILLKGEF